MRLSAAFAVGVLMPGSVLLAQQEVPVPVVCDILAKAAEPDPAFDALELAVGPKVYQYFETRRGKRKRYRQPEKEIGLRVLHLDTCTTEVITILKSGSIPVSPQGWHVQVEVRHNGIQWNGVNSQFDVEEPENVVVLANKVPDVREVFATQTVRGKDGASRRVKVSVGWEVEEYRVYAPYTVAAHRPEVVVAGDTYLLEIIAWAFNDLRVRGVRTPAVQDRSVADLFQPDWFYRIALNEHMDFGEFSVNDEWKQWSAERVLVSLALNRERTNIDNCNFAGACGLYQFTDNGRRRHGRWLPGTYAILVNKFPQAGLIPDFKTGAADHRNIAKAAILHHVMILEEFISDFGPGVLDSPYLEAALGIGYNGGYGAANRAAIRAAFKAKDPVWFRKLRKREAREYEAKRQFLVSFMPNGAPLPEQN